MAYIRQVVGAARTRVKTVAEIADHLIFFVTISLMKGVRAFQKRRCTGSPEMAEDWLQWIILT